MSHIFRCQKCGAEIIVDSPPEGEIIKCWNCMADLPLSQESLASGDITIRLGEEVLIPAARADRIAAGIIDCLIYVVPLMCIFLSAEYQELAVLGMIVILGLLIIQVTLLTISGKTIGKNLRKIRIVDYRTGLNGGFVPNWLVRSFMNTLLCTIPLYALADLLCFFRADRRCVHDLLAETVVVKDTRGSKMLV